MTVHVAPPAAATPARSACEDDLRIAARLKAIRQAKRVSMEALGRAANISIQQVQKIEAGRNRISAGRLAVFARILDVPVGSFYAGDDADPSSAPAPDTAGLLAVPGALEMLRAYADIAPPTLRRPVLDFVRAAGLCPAQAE